MPYTTLARNLMLDALKGTNPTTPITHAGLFTKQAGKAFTGVTSTDVATATAHGYSNGDVVVLSGLTGGASLVAGWIYFIVATATNTFQLAETPGGAAVDFGTDVSAGTVSRLVEVSGGAPAYARKAIAYAAAAGAILDDSTNGAVFDVPAGAVVDYVGMHSAVTAGSILDLEPVTQETFGAQGTYTLTDAKLGLRA